MEFLPAGVDDVTALIRGRCEVPVAPDLVHFVTKLSKGYNREVLDAIANIERFGRRMDPGAEGVTLADMAGLVIMRNRDTGKDIVVPEAA